MRDILDFEHYGVDNFENQQNEPSFKKDFSS